MELIQASAARQIAQGVNDLEEKLEDIANKIEEAANEGKYKIYITDGLEGKLSFLFKEAGYKLEQTPLGIMINWEP